MRILYNRKAEYCHLNMACIYHEKLSNIQKVIEYLNKSLQIWRALNDTLNQANILKYRGVLAAEVDSSTKGKTDIKSSISMFM